MRKDFFILSLFVGYVLSVGLVRLRTVRLSTRAGAQTECRCSRSNAEDMTITNVIIKTPDRTKDRGVNDVMPGSDGRGILVIFEKSSQLRFDAGRGELRSVSGRGELIFRPAEVDGMRRAFVGSVG